MATEEKDTIIVVSKVKGLIKAAGMRSGDDFLETLNSQVHMIITAAVNEAKRQERQTLKGEDI